LPENSKQPNSAAHNATVQCVEPPMRFEGCGCPCGQAAAAEKRHRQLLRLPVPVELVAAAAQVASRCKQQQRSQQRAGREGSNPSYRPQIAKTVCSQANNAATAAAAAASPNQASGCGRPRGEPQQATAAQPTVGRSGRQQPQATVHRLLPWQAAKHRAQATAGKQGAAKQRGHPRADAATATATGRP